MPKQPFNFNAEDQTLISVKPRKPFVDWINKFSPTSIVSIESAGMCLFFFPNFNNDSEYEAYLRIHYNSMFEKMLYEWRRDEKEFPQNRTFELFLEWFEISTFDKELEVIDVIDNTSD